ncbi:MAG TPA: DUF952 domain-containing protein [Caulobacteraceae bacterium]
MAPSREQDGVQARTIYKILSRAEWRQAVAKGRFDGSNADRRDGFIHFSIARQVNETARLHFSGRADLVLLEVRTSGLGANLKWERSRGGELFPHLYGPLSCDRVAEVRAAPLGDDGRHDLGELVP